RSSVGRAEQPTAPLPRPVAAATVALLGDAHVRFASLSIRTAPAAGASELVRPSSQRTRYRGGLLLRSSSITPTLPCWPARSLSTTIGRRPLPSRRLLSAGRASQAEPRTEHVVMLP